MNESQIKKLDEILKHPEFLAIKWLSNDEKLEGFNPVIKGFGLYLDVIGPEGLTVAILPDLHYTAFGHVGNLIRIIALDDNDGDDVPWIDIKIKKGHPMYRPGIFG